MFRFIQAIQFPPFVSARTLFRAPTETGRELAGTALGIIFAPMILTTLSLLFFSAVVVKSDD